MKLFEKNTCFVIRNIEFKNRYEFKKMFYYDFEMFLKNIRSTANYSK